MPARAEGPARLTRSTSSSGCRDENKTWWPAFAHNTPSVPPILPEPMMPIFIGVDCARANGPVGSMARPAHSAKARRVTRRRTKISFISISLNVRRFDPIMQCHAAVDHDGGSGDIRREPIGQQCDCHPGDIVRGTEPTQAGATGEPL